MRYARAVRPLGVARRSRAVKVRNSGPGPVGLVTGGDHGSQVRTLVALQGTFGNRAVSRLVAAYAGGGSGASVSLHGRTWGDYDGGTSTVSKVKAAKATGCDCSGDDPCYQVSGVLKVDYHVDVTIEMPEVPDGLTKCQQKRVQDFLTNVLGPHEQEHARRIRAYNGTTVRPFSAKDCGRDAAMTAAQAKAQEMHDTEAAQRSADADASSLAIDPFNKTIDLDC